MREKERERERERRREREKKRKEYLKSLKKGTRIISIAASTFFARTFARALSLVARGILRARILARRGCSSRRDFFYLCKALSLSLSFFVESAEKEDSVARGERNRKS